MAHITLLTGSVATKKKWLSLLRMINMYKNSHFGPHAKLTRLKAQGAGEDSESQRDEVSHPRSQSYSCSGTQVSPAKARQLTSKL